MCDVKIKGMFCGEDWKCHYCFDTFTRIDRHLHSLATLTTAKLDSIAYALDVGTPGNME